MATFPTPPVDGSGGYAEILANDSIDSHVMRVHLAPFSIGGVTTSPFNYPYAATHGAETGVNDTLQALMNIIKLGYDATWDLIVQSLWLNSGGVLTPVFPVPVAAASGSNGLAAVQAYDPARATVQHLSLRTTNTTGRTRYGNHLVCWGSHDDPLNGNTLTTGTVPQEVVLIQANAGGTIYQKLVNYITQGSAANGLRAHDGFIPQGIAKATYSQSQRLRRRYGMA